MAAYAIDYINGTYLCACEGSDLSFVNLDTGEIQCAVDCGDCSKAWSFQDNQFNPICDE